MARDRDATLASSHVGAVCGVSALRAAAFCLLVGVLLLGCGGESTCDPEVLTGTVDSRVLVGASCDQIRVEGTVYVAAGGTLTIREGSTLTFQRGAGLIVDEGSISAAGASEAPIIMTGAEATPGFWQGVLLRQPASETAQLLSNTIIEYAGSKPFHGGHPAGLTIIGHPAASSPIKINGSTFRFNKGHGTYIHAPGSIAQNVCSIEAARYDSNSEAHVRLIGGANCIRPSITFSPSERPDVLLESLGSQNQSINHSEARIVPEEDLRLAAGQILYLASGTTLTFPPGIKVVAEGGMIHGTRESPTPILRGAADLPGAWPGIQIEPGAQFELYGVVVTGAGEPGPDDASDAPSRSAAVTARENSRVRIEYVTLTESAGYGLLSERGAEAEINHSHFSANALGAAHLDWPAIHGFVMGNTFGPDEVADAVIFRTEVEPYNVTLQLPTLPTRLIIDSGSLYKLFVPAGADVEITSDLGLDEIIMGEGSTISFHRHVTLHTYAFNSEGSPDQPVILQPVPSADHWGGVSATIGGEHSFRHTVIRKAGMDASGPRPALKIEGYATVDVATAAFLENAAGGVSIGPLATVTGCSAAVFEGNGGPDFSGAPCAD